MEFQTLNVVSVHRGQGAVVRGQKKFKDLDVWKRAARSAMLVGLIK